LSRRGVKQCKDIVLKTRLQTLIKQAGMTNSEFYNKVDISRQYYYFLSWGLWRCPLDLKLRIAKVLNTDSGLIWGSRE
jgi:DNA-binding XRE family transcriptional regulator